MNQQGPITAHVAEQVRHHRRQQGMSQTELGQAAGIDRAVLANLETGRRESISVDEVYTLAHVLGLVPASLLPDLGGRVTFDQAMQLVRDRYTEAIEQLKAT